MTSSGSPKVCVGIMTYNQAEFIGQAIDSALAQKTDFPFEIVVHDDCSTDGTKEIVEGYLAANPGKVHAILQTENQYSKGRRIAPILLAGMRGDYFALLDGDDFWQSDRKLQAQVDFLDANPDCVICQTKTVYFDEIKQRVDSIFPPPDRRRTRHENADLAPANFLQTSAVMFRASAVPAFPPAFEQLSFGDYPLFALMSQAGWIGLIDEEMTTYRIHGDNLWVGTPDQARIVATQKVQLFLSEHLDPEYRQPWIDAATAPPPRDEPSRLSRLRRRMGFPPLLPSVRRALGIRPR